MTALRSALVDTLEESEEPPDWISSWVMFTDWRGGVSVIVGVGVCVGVFEAVGVNDGVNVGVAVKVLVGVGVIVGDAV